MHIAIAQNATIGNVYPITLSFATVTPGSSGVSIGSSIEKSFEVIVGQRIEKPGIPVAVWILIAIVVVIIAVVLLTKKKKRK
jgi:ribose/xylose/arabinose/galactoside ABC-type transport system permease subunit